MSLKYEKPLIIPLNDLRAETGLGAKTCLDGSAAAGHCNSGGTPADKCFTGSSAPAANCFTGETAGNACQTGLTAVGRCNTGTDPDGVSIS